MSKEIGQLNSKELFTIPNLITYFRILCVPVFVILMAFAGIRASKPMFYSALGIFIVAAGSDLIDGYIARKFKMQSGIGMALDPLADKLMQVSILICLSLCTGLTKFGSEHSLKIDGVVKGGLFYVHWGFVIAAFAKEFVMFCVALGVLKKGIEVKANWLGKIASLTLCVGIIVAFFHDKVYFADWGIIAWGMFLTYCSGINYGIIVAKQAKKLKNGEIEKVTSESVREKDIEINENK